MPIDPTARRGHGEVVALRYITTDSRIELCWPCRVVEDRDDRRDWRPPPEWDVPALVGGWDRAPRTLWELRRSAYADSTPES
jgi:hypothetical protein